MVYRDRRDRDIGDLETGSRVCKVCDARKPMVEFYRCGPSREYRSRTCRGCWAVRDANRGSAAWSDEVDREYRLRQTYGISSEQYDKAMARQNGRCAICQVEFDDDVIVHLDHCHDSGKVRGLLCMGCNRAIGYFGEDVESMRRAITYVTELPFEIERIGPLTAEEKRERRRQGQLRRKEAQDA